MYLSNPTIVLNPSISEIVELQPAVFYIPWIQNFSILQTLDFEPFNKWIEIRIERGLYMQLIFLILCFLGLAMVLTFHLNRLVWS